MWPHGSHSARTVCPSATRHKHLAEKSRCVVTDLPPPDDPTGAKTAASGAGTVVSTPYDWAEGLHDQGKEGLAMPLVLPDGRLMSKRQTDVGQTLKQAPAAQ